ncbi:MAG: PD-(D/E)XK nuclease family protein [Candidatus Firestonebacteria bacterium]
MNNNKDIMKEYSPSALGTFGNCPRQYRFAYIEKPDIVKRASIEAFLGSRVHDALEELYKNIIMSKVLSLDELLDCYREIWAKEWTDDIVIRKIKYTKEDCKNAGEEWLKKYYKRYYPFDKGTVVFLEENLYGHLDIEKKYKIKGLPDRVVKIENGYYEIHDYKTSNRLPSITQLMVDRQLVMYQIVLMNKLEDVKKVDLIWHYLRFDEEMIVSHTLEKLEDIKLQIIEIIKKIESEVDFKTNESGLCPWCDYVEICPAKTLL